MPTFVNLYIHIYRFITKFENVKPYLQIHNYNLKYVQQTISTF